MKKLQIWMLFSLLIIGLSACNEHNTSQKINKAPQSSIDYNNWQAVLSNAENGTVNFYGWGGDERINAYVDDILAPYLKKNYNVKLNRVPMDIDIILSTLSSEKLANANESIIDVMWINGENFASAKEHDFLMPNITEYVPNYKYVDLNDRSINFDFGTPVEGYEAPYGKAQFVFVSANNNLYPLSAQKLLDYCKISPGKLTYTAPPDFTGSAFIRNIIVDIVGENVIYNLPNDKAAVKKAIQPALDYLITLNQYLWQSGDAYPSTYAELDQMFQDGLIDMTMTYDPLSVLSKVNTGLYPDDIQTFAFKNGSLSNTHFLAISKHAKNKAAALCLIDAMLSPEMQAAKLNPEIWGSLPSIAVEQTNDLQRQQFDFQSIDKNIVNLDKMYKSQIAEPPSYLIPIFEELWLEEVAGQHAK